MERPTELMRDAKTIAVVGVTTTKVRPANEIAQYLINAGFEVYLVNETEAGDQMLGKTIQPSVESLNVPIDIVVSARNEVAPDGDLWLSVLESTAQPLEMR